MGDEVNSPGNSQRSLIIKFSAFKDECGLAKLRCGFFFLSFFFSF